MSDQAQLFLQAFNKGAVCLHPCDTIPGLTADPFNQQAWAELLALKGRDADKPISGLVPDLEAAESYWLPLPESVRECLTQIWPAPLTIIWQAAKDAPKSLVSSRGEIGLRVPLIDPRIGWLSEVLQSIRSPLPTTSVNASGTPHATNWREAVSMAQALGDVYIPSGDHFDTHSTVARIVDANQIQVIRSGAFSDWKAYWKGEISGL